MTKPFKPMLAADISADLDKLRFPVYATPKLDGVRAMVFGNTVFSRTMKKFPNRSVHAEFALSGLNGLDGELIVGNPTDKDVLRKTTSVVASLENETPISYYVFDKYDVPNEGYEWRLQMLQRKVDEINRINPLIQVHHVPSTLCSSLDELVGVEEGYLAEGYEGLIARSPTGTYKNGRSTLKEQGMLKLKRFVDSEAEVLSVEEEMHNANEAKVNALGHTERSSHKANLVGKGTMGVLVCRDIHDGRTVRIGTGFTAADRAKKWLTGTIVKYEHFPHGAKDKPRHARFISIREDFDL